MAERHNTPGTPEYFQRTQDLRAAGFEQEADARDRFSMVPNLAASHDHARSIQVIRNCIDADFQPSRERSLALTKLEEAEMWLGRAPR